MKSYKIEIEFIRDILGSNTADEEIKQTYIKAKMITGRTGVSGEIATKKLDEEQRNNLKDPELAKLIESVDIPSLTVFYRDEKGKPCIADHQLRGFVKEAFAFLNGQNKYLTRKLKEGETVVTAYREDYSKRWIAERISFGSRFYNFKKKPNIEIMERPIKAMTMQGPRVALKSSEVIKAGNGITITIKTTDDVEEKILREVFTRGEWHGLGQWANSQAGSFKVKSFKKGK